MRYIVLFFVMMVGHFAGLASAQGLRSGPMAGFTDMQSTTIWLLGWTLVIVEVKTH